jgi:hypothetical protein
MFKRTTNAAAKALPANLARAVTAAAKRANAQKKKGDDGKSRPQN